MNGWTGAILRVCLSDSTVSTIPTEPYARDYVGGRGIASRLYWEMVSPEVSAFEPENVLILMTGPLVATGAQGATRMSVVGKSPMTYPEGFCFANMGGFFGPELKRAGFDGLIVEGCAPKPVYLWIHDGTVESLDASTLWGHGAYETGETLRYTHGDKARFITTGPAGENKVRSAIVYGSHESTSCAGFGAVMGSKNLKAVVVRGAGRPTVADAQTLKNLNRYTVDICKRVTLVAPPIVAATKHAHLVEVIGKGGCDHCGLTCNRQLYRYGHRLEGYRRCQSMEYYLPWRYSLEDEPLETFFDAPSLANDCSIGTFELQNMIDWLYACHRSGSLTEEETGLPLSRIGTKEFLEKLLSSVSYRVGFGDVLAEGLVRAVAHVPRRASEMLDNTVAPTGQYDVFPARAIVAHGLIYPMEPRVHQSILHEIGFVRAAWTLNQARPDLSPVTTRVVHNIARVFWGSDEAGDLSSYGGKALAAKKIQNRSYLKDSLGLCDFAWPITYSFSTPDHLGDPDLEAKIFNAVTGSGDTDLEQCAERICTTQRAILVREGRKIPEDDFPHEFNFTEPLGSSSHGRKMLVPGPGDETVDATGKSLDRSRFTRLLKDYYGLRGWNEESGQPQPETLRALGLDELMPLFENRQGSGSL
jgi:aldehyde:ferredoxin oxidoreductase